MACCNTPIEATEAPTRTLTCTQAPFGTLAYPSLGAITDATTGAITQATTRLSVTMRWFSYHDGFTDLNLLNNDIII